ncbi:Fic family protein [bacterium]|nr:Fic family protein [bacterium]
MNRKSKQTMGQQLALALKEVKKNSRDHIVKSNRISRKVREQLTRAGYLVDVIQGWYLLTTPGIEGNSDVWYGFYWSFIRQYLTERFGKTGYCLSADHSMNLHAGETIIPEQLVVITKKASNQAIELPFKTSLLIYSDKTNFPKKISKINDINVMMQETALCRLSPAYYVEKAENILLVLNLYQSVVALSKQLIETASLSSAERLAGAFQSMGLKGYADQIISDMKLAGYHIKAENSFQRKKLVVSSRQIYSSPYPARIELLWQSMRKDIQDNFPQPAKKKEFRVLKKIRDLYTHDAYHSLSIEGYQVTEELIQKIAAGKWNPAENIHDRDLFSGLSAKGYQDAFQSVLQSIQKTKLQTKQGQIVSRDLQTWYRALFTPFVKSGLYQASDIIGYRNQPVYIRNSRHIPLPNHSLVDVMEKYYDLLKNEDNPAVKAVLGHFMFVNIHPYMDGNGRLGRFLMNYMLVTGGYHWTVIRVSERTRYMKTLESASVEKNIIPFTRFIADEMAYWDELDDRR